MGRRTHKHGEEDPSVHTLLPSSHYTYPILWSEVVKINRTDAG